MRYEKRGNILRGGWRYIAVLLMAALMLCTVWMTGCGVKSEDNAGALSTGNGVGIGASDADSEDMGTSESVSDAGTDGAGTTESASDGTDTAAAGEATGTATGSTGDPDAEDTRTIEEMYPGIDFSGLPEAAPQDYPRVDGSTACLPLSYALYRAVTGATETEAESNITCSRTDNSYYSITGDPEYGAHLLLAYKPSEQAAEDAKSSGVGLQIQPIGRDALVFVENNGNPVHSLTGDQLRDIYSGRITSWSQVGGQDLPIRAFQRPEGSGSQTLMNAYVMKGAAMAPAPSYMVPSSMGELITNVSYYTNTINAIGYSVYYYARNMESRPGLRFVAVDGVAPNNKTIADGSYPYVNDFYAVIRDDEPDDSLAHQIFDWLQSSDGQALIEACGYVPVAGAGKATGAVDGTGSINGKISGGSGKPVAGGNDRSEPVPSVMPSIEKGLGVYVFPEGEQLILNGRDTLNEDGIFVVDEHMETLQHVEGVALATSMLVRDPDESLLAVDGSSGRYGVYGMAGEDWVVAPDYSFANDYTDEFDGKPVFVLERWESADGGVTSEDNAGTAGTTVDDTVDADEPDSDDGAYVSYLYAGGQMQRIGSNYAVMDGLLWSTAPDDAGSQVVTCYDSNGRKVRSIDLSDAVVDRVWFAGGCICGVDTSGSVVIFDQKGKVIFKPSMLEGVFEKIAGARSMDGYLINTNGVNPDGALVSGTVVTEDYSWSGDYLYNRKTGQLLSGKDDTVQQDILESDGANDMTGNVRGSMRYVFTTISTDGTRRVYLDDGTMLKDVDGHPFEYALGMDYYGRYINRKTGEFLVARADGTSGESSTADETISYHYMVQVPTKDDGVWFSPVRAIARDTFILQLNEVESSLVQEQKTILDSGSAWDSYVSEELVSVSDEDGNCLLIRKSDGAILFRADGEYITGAAGPVIMTQQGPYNRFRTTDGTTVLKIMNGFYTED